MSDPKDRSGYDTHDTVKEMEAVVVARFRSERPPPSDSEVALQIREDIVRNSAGPDRVTCPCCGLPDACTEERIDDFRRICAAHDTQLPPPPLMPTTPRR